MSVQTESTVDRLLEWLSHKGRASDWAVKQTGRRLGLDQDGGRFAWWYGIQRDGHIGRVNGHWQVLPPTAVWRTEDGAIVAEIFGARTRRMRERLIDLGLQIDDREGAARWRMQALDEADLQRKLSEHSLFPERSLDLLRSLPPLDHLLTTFIRQAEPSSAMPERWYVFRQGRGRWARDQPDAAGGPSLGRLKSAGRPAWFYRDGGRMWELRTRRLRTAARWRLAPPDALTFTEATLQAPLSPPLPLVLDLVLRARGCWPTASLGGWRYPHVPTAVAAEFARILDQNLHCLAQSASDKRVPS